MSSNTLLIANDAGGANSLLSVIEKRKKYKAYATGPSKKILLNIKNISFVNEFELLDFSEILIATSQHDKKWLEVLVSCAEKKLNYWIVMDHWTNYASRFYYYGEKINPSKLITLDPFATEIAQKEFPNAKVWQRRNLNLEQQILTVAKKRKSNPQKNYLFIGEYTDHFIAENGLYYEQLLFEKLCKYLIKNEPSANLVVRPHPSERVDKYNFCKSIFPFEVSRGSLEDDLSHALLVLGHDSHALFVAHECKVDCKRLKLINYDMNCMLPINLPSMIIG